MVTRRARAEGWAGLTQAEWLPGPARRLVRSRELPNGEEPEQRPVPGPPPRPHSYFSLLGQISGELGLDEVSDFISWEECPLSTALGLLGALSLRR